MVREIFHINHPASWNKVPKMNVGDKFTIGDSVNPYMAWFNFPPTIKLGPIDDGAERTPMMSYTRFLLTNRDDHPNAFEIAYEVANFFSRLTTELVCEQVRLAEFPAKPSRQKALWVTDTEQDALRWASAMKKTRYQIVRLSADGEFQTADAALLMDGNIGYAEGVQAARRYWQGDRSDDPLFETLFVGKVEVLAVTRSVGKAW